MAYIHCTELNSMYSIKTQYTLNFVRKIILQLYIIAQIR